MSTLTHIRENRDDYPLTNIRWTHALLWFIALPALAGLSENDPQLAIGGAALGLAFCILLSLGMYGMDHYAESVPARIVIAALLAAMLTFLVAVVAVIALTIVAVLTPTVALGVFALCAFLAIFYFLS